MTNVHRLPKAERITRKEEIQRATESLRDDVISVIRNSPLTFEDIHARCGPHPTTLIKWLERTTKRPHVSTMVAALQACGHQLKIVRAR